MTALSMAAAELSAETAAQWLVLVAVPALVVSNFTVSKVVAEVDIEIAQSNSGD